VAKKFPSLSNFLDSAKKIERSSLETAIDEGTEKEVQRILSASSVVLSVYNQSSQAKSTDASTTNNTAEFIQQGIKEATALNATRVKSILDDIFFSLSLDKEREVFWIQKLCALFNIDKDLSNEDKSALIEKQLAENDDTINYVTYLVESGEKKTKN
jgi:hypothetical protein